MRQVKALLLAALAAGALLLAASPAEAQWRGRGWRGGYYPGYSYWRPGFSLSFGINTPRYWGGYYGPTYRYSWPRYYGYYPGYYSYYPSYSYYGGYYPGYYSYGYYPSYSYPGYYPSYSSVYVPSWDPAAVASASTAAATATATTRQSGYYAPTTDNRARVRVHLPAGAELWVAGEKTSQTGAEREFVTPPLTPGTNYSYEMKARWTEAGRPVEETRKVYVRANETTEVAFGKGS